MTRFLVVVPTHRPQLAQQTIDKLRSSITYPTEFHQLDGRPSKVHALNKALEELLDVNRHDVYCTVDDDLILPPNWQHFIACAFDRIPTLGACGIDYQGTTEGEQLMAAGNTVKPAKVKDVIFRDVTGVMNLAGGVMAMPSKLAKEIGPYPFANDGRQYHADEDAWRSHQVTKRGRRVGYVTNCNGTVQFMDYDDNPLYVMRKERDIQNWLSNPNWNTRSVIATPEEVSLRIVEPKVSVVVLTHNYAHFLSECLQSIIDSTVRPKEIIVVDDSSDDDPKSICEQFPDITYVRCEERNLHRSTLVGLQASTGKYVCFIDADDMLSPDYLQEAVKTLNEDRNAAIAFPRLLSFGDKKGWANATELSPEVVTSEDIENHNRIPSSSMYRAELLRQSLVAKTPVDKDKCFLQDWNLARHVLRSGVWRARQVKPPLLYRKHATSMSTRVVGNYYDDANLANEVITIAIAFSGRWDAWARLRTWLFSQYRREETISLLILNSSHKPVTVGRLGLENWTGNIQIVRVDAGYPGLSDFERRERPDIQRDVSVAVAAVYNRAFRLVNTEFVLFIEDDIIPHRLDTIEVMLRAMDIWVAGVSGVYRQRYQADKCCAFDLPHTGVLKDMGGSGIETVGGSGFGLLLTRRSVIRRVPLLTEQEVPWFDPDFCTEVSKLDGGNWRWLLHRDVTAEHLVTGDLVPMPPAAKPRK